MVSPDNEHVVLASTDDLSPTPNPWCCLDHVRYFHTICEYSVVVLTAALVGIEHSSTCSSTHVRFKAIHQALQHNDSDDRTSAAGQQSASTQQGDMRCQAHDILLQCVRRPKHMSRLGQAHLATQTAMPTTRQYSSSLTVQGIRGWPRLQNAALPHL